MLTIERLENRSVIYCLNSIKFTFYWLPAAGRREGGTPRPSSPGADPPPPRRYRRPCWRTGTGGSRGSRPARTVARQAPQTLGP